MNIAWYSYYPDPWANSIMKMWTHHADIMELISHQYPIEIYTMVKPRGIKNIHKYNDGDNSVVIPGFREIKFHFNETSDNEYLDKIDACFLEVSRIQLCVPGFSSKSEEAKLIENSLKHKVKYFMERNIPIIWYDGDGDLYIPKQSRDENFCIRLYNDLDMKNYKNITVIGPYMMGLYENSKYVDINNFKFVPYNINFDKINKEVLDSEKRFYLTTYVGNNFRRSNLYEVFNNMSKFGKIRIFGDYRWKRDRFDSDIELNGPLISDTGFNKYFDESLIGIYGTHSMGNKIGHFTLRVTEYIRAGIYIVPENEEYLKKLIKSEITVDDFKSDNIESCKNKLKNLSDNYVSLVNDQREKLSEFFDSKKLYKVYLKAWNLEEV